MKKLWLVLLSLSLVMVFSVSAFAVDVKVSAEYYAAGLYLNKTSVLDDDYMPNPSTAFFYQRLRVGTDFVVSPCLKLVTRFDAMERIWGGARSGGVDPYTPTDVLQSSYSAGTRQENENIAFDIAYVSYTSPIGLFEVGYMPDYDFGTIFADKGEQLYNGQIKYFIQKGPFIGFIGYSKVAEKNLSYQSSTYPATDVDYDSYRVAGIYQFNTAQAKGEAGALFLFDRNALYKGGYSPYSGMLGPYGNFLQNVYVIDPYVKAKIGPVALQAELLYYFGDAARWEGYGGYTYSPNVSIGALSAFVDATADLGTFYVGGTFAYLSGDDPNTSDKLEGSGLDTKVNTAGANYNPCLMLFNSANLGYWAGSIYGHDGSALDAEMSNAWFFQGRVGVKPTPQWDVLLAVSYAQADKKPEGFTGGTYGTEIDLTGTYKITNNLSYMLGVGYLFTGDYFKGIDDGANKVNDDYILINKLTLSF